MMRFFKVGMLSVLLLTGCGKFNVADVTHDYLHPVPEKPVKLPYNFFLDTVLDARIQGQEPRLIDHLSKRKMYPFKEEIFSKKLVKKINGVNLYDYEDALLRVELLDYAAFREDFNYTLSFYLDLTGFDEKGKVLATGKFSCVSERHEAQALFDKVKGVFKHDQDRQTEMKQKQKEVWNMLYEDCLTDIAREFNNKVRLWGRG